jgi:hypothetical protein
MPPRLMRGPGSILMLGLGLVAIAASYARSIPPARSSTPRVESYAIERADSLNERIAAATRAGERWTHDPVRVALEVSGESPEFARSLDLRYEGNAGERPDSAVVTLVADGYADDSVRGTWVRLRLARQGDDAWRVVEVQRAWRCWRGHHRESYSKQPCL